MTSDTLTLDGGSANALARLGQLAAEPTKLDDGEIYAVKVGDSIELLETPGYTYTAANERQAEGPARINRRVVLRDAQSLIAYLAANTDADDPTNIGMSHRHGVGDLEIWADLDGRRIKAILDGGYGWAEHTATLELRHSREWDEWSKIDGKLLPQVTFAEFIEDHLSSIGAPDGGTLLDIVQTLTAKNKVDFKSSSLLANGQRQFEFAETLEAKAGQKGNLTIPTELTLVLRPFQGSEDVGIQARFRYRLDGGQLFLGVRLNEPAKALEEAFDVIVDEVRAASPVPIVHGIG